MTTSFPQPIELLQQLIRFNTVNPPGNEAPCIQFIARLLRQVGIESTILARDPQRPNLIARLPGRGEAPPLLLYGHIDVVTTENQRWTYPPFEGTIADGFVWGRGAIDDKGGIVLLLSAFIRAWQEQLAPAGDLILAIVSDEEDGGSYGARFLVEQHPEQFEGVRYAIGEGGGVSVWMGGKKFYAIMVTEKQTCSLMATVRGRSGHGSMPIRGGAMAGLAAILQTLDRKRLPVHVTPTSNQMLNAIAGALPFPQNLAIRGLLTPPLTGRILDLLGQQGELINPLLHNTVSPTIIHGGNAINVHPGEINLALDGRLLPGFGPEDLERELGTLLQNNVELEVTNYEPGPASPDMTLYEMLADILRAADPSGIPIPLLVSGVTDARFFARLGIQTYGYLPMDLPGGLIDTVHAADERIPIETIGFGIDAIFQVIQQYRL